VITEFPVLTPSGGPGGIAAGPDGNLWFTERNANQIGRITTAGVVTEFVIPTAASQPEGIAAGPDGNLWFTERNGNKIGRITAGGAFFTLTPCRVVDTRNPVGPLGGPALVANTDRTFPVAGQCGIPSGAKAIAATLTVTGPTDLGDLRAYPAGAPLPLASSINYRPGQTRANNALLQLGVAGGLAIRCDQASGTVHFILDVTGYFN
jgi:hypothetical protein